MQVMSKNIFLRICFIVFLTLCFVQQAKTSVKLPVLISDGMVLQREQNLCIWGISDPNEYVTVSFLKKKYQTRADEHGKWNITLPPMKAGGPYTMNINELQLKDILIGDVWLCSGQSNMELPISRVTDKYRTEIETDSNLMIRHIKIPLDYNFHSPQSDVKQCMWKSLTPENAMSFSALAYFFAKDLYAKTKIPIGLINSSVGGSPVEAWIGEEGLKPFPQYLNDKSIYESDDYVNDVKKLEWTRQNLWNEILYRQDIGLHESTPWYSFEYDDSFWKTTDLFSTWWATNGLSPINGSHWFRKEFDLPQNLAGKEAILRLGRIVDADSVYLNGVFVGTISYQYPPRIYKIPANLLKAGKNIVTVRLLSYGGLPEFVKDKPYKLICQGEEINLEGEWKYKPGAEMPALPGQTSFQYKPVGLYNAMIAPLIKYNVAGAIWYQGESNVGRYNEYDSLLSALIKDWRQKWNSPDLPFIIVQLPNFMQSHTYPVESYWAQLRDRQLNVTRTVQNTGLAVAIDLGEWNDIHPLNKKDLGRRISLQAQRLFYGDKEIICDGPVYKSMTIEGNKIILSFQEGTDDFLPVKKLKGFSIAGKDKIFKWAEACVEGKKIVVWNDEIPNPVMVRYGWEDNPDGINLYNKSQLPASPFRTDY
jgi:sialate O-acetylesterase